MSKSKFVINSFIYTLGDILPKLIAFFMIPLYTKYLNTTDYGIVNTVSTIMSFFSVFYLLGLEGALTRFFYEYRDTSKQKEFISTLWIFLLVYNLLLTIGMLVFGMPLSKILLKSIPFDPFFKLMILNCFFTTFTIMPSVLLRLKEKAFTFGLLNGLTTIVNILFIIYFVVYLKMGAEGNIRGYVFTSITFSIIYLIITVKDIKFMFSMRIIKEGIKYGIPLIPHAIGGWILAASDRWLLTTFRTTSEVGIYSLGIQFGMLVYYILLSINKAYVPFFFKTATEEPNARSIFEVVIEYYSIIILSLSLGLALFSREIIIIMVSNKEYYAAANIIPLIVLAYVFNGYYFMSVNGIFYSKKTKVLGITTAVISLVSLSLNLLLIPTFGIYGAAVTMVSCYFILFVVTYSVSQRYYFIKWNWKKIVLNLSICIIIFLLGLVNFNGFTYNFLYKIILFMVYILMLFVFKILTYEVLHKFFKIIVPKNR